MRKAEATDNVLFDRFWVAYPKKVGKEKARRAFEKVHPTEDQQKISLFGCWKPSRNKAVSIPGTRRPGNTFRTLQPG